MRNKQSNRLNVKAGYGISIMGNKCYRCGHEWRPVNLLCRPRVCPKCKSPYWDVPKR